MLPVAIGHLPLVRGAPQPHGLRGHLRAPCRRRRQLAKVQGRISDLLAKLPPGERAVYDATEAETESGWDPMPPPPSLAGLGRYERARAEEAREIAVEDWLARNLRRQVKAAQKRKERIEKKLK